MEGGSRSRPQRAASLGPTPRPSSLSAAQAGGSRAFSSPERPWVGREAPSRGPTFTPASYLLRDLEENDLVWKAGFPSWHPILGPHGAGSASFSDPLSPRWPASYQRGALKIYIYTRNFKMESSSLTYMSPY